MATKLKLKNSSLSTEAKLVAATRSKEKTTALETARLRYVKAFKALMAFKAEHNDVFKDFAQVVANEYNEANVQLRDMLREQKPGTRVESFLLFTEDSTKVDLGKLYKKVPAILTIPGVVTGIDLQAALDAAEKLGVAAAFKSCTETTTTKKVRGPQKMELKWPKD